MRGGRDGVETRMDRAALKSLLTIDAATWCSLGRRQSDLVDRVAPPDASPEPS